MFRVPVLMLELRNFQKRFLRAATSPAYDTVAMTLPRGNGKSRLAAHILTRVMDPDDDLFRPGTESVLGAASIEQARICFRFVRADLEGKPGYRFLDSHTRIGIVHVPTNTRLRVISSNGKTAMGLVDTPYAVLDEPGSYEVVGGQLLWDAIATAQGKPGSPMKAIVIGTLAPASAGWWHDLVEAGTGGSVYVQALRGNPERWDQWAEIRRCNPLTAVSATFRKKLLEERDAARADTRLKGRFFSYRLNIPTADESTVLLTLDDWQRVLARPVPAREGRPIVAYDLGGGRAWSAAVAMWRTGAMSAIALAPGLPSLEEQEKRDRVPAGTYRRLAETGALHVAHGLRVQPPAALQDAALAAWGRPAAIYCDRFRLAELQDVVKGCTLVARITRWSEASEDIRSLRKIAADGPLACEETSRLLVAASLAVATVKNDDQGSVRLVKRGSNNTSRDDVAAALLLVAGAHVRTAGRPRPKLRYALAG